MRPVEGTLSRGSETTRLEPRVMEVLVYLAGQAGRVVSRNAILEAVWEGGFVEEGVLSRCIFDIRRALGDNARSPRYIETLPKRGYRLLGLVSKTSDSAAEERRPGLGSIAVLPFADLSPEQDQEHFTDGLAEELIHALTAVRDLRVVARTSAFSFKGSGRDVREIAGELGVATVLEGSVRKAGERVRITVQLVEAERGFHLWSETFDRVLADIFEVQDEIARAVVERVSPQQRPWSGDRPLVTQSTSNLEAYDLALAGLSEARRLTRTGLERSVRLLERAIALDPGYARAFSYLSASHLSLALYHRLEEPDAWSRSREAAERALELDDGLAAPHAALGMVEIFSWNWEAAERCTARAIELAPGHAYARDVRRFLLMVTGRTGEAVQSATLACELDPLVPLNQRALGMANFVDRQYRRALPPLERALTLNPRLPYCHAVRASVHWALGERSSALADLGREFWIRHLAADRHPDLQGAAATEEARLRRWIAAFADAEPFPGRLFFGAVFHSWLGELEPTLDLLARAVEARDAPAIHLLEWPSFRFLHDEPRYRALLEEMGLASLLEAEA